jgi:uncharacterized protein YciI
MLYAIIATDNENSLVKRQSVRPTHIARLEELKEQNRLILAGPNPIEGSDEFSGSLVIAEFNSLDEAQVWANDDPYFYSGAYKEVVVKPFKKVLP